MSQLITGSGEPHADWHDAEWARRAGNLSAAERARRTTAVTVLLESTDDISDVLYSELVILLEALQGDDPKPASAEAAAR